MANLTNSAKLIEEMNKKANRTELPEVNNSTVNFTINGNTGSQSMTTNQPSNSTVNLTVTKATVGLGNVDNTSDANKPISTATQAALDLKADKSDLSSVYKHKGSVASYSNLPSTGLTAGDVYNVEDTGMNYAWTGSAWDQLGVSVDLSNYLAKNNTTTFTPTGDYNPATKKYVDDSVSSLGKGVDVVTQSEYKQLTPEEDKAYFIKQQSGGGTTLGFEIVEGANKLQTQPTLCTGYFTGGTIGQTPYATYVSGTISISVTADKVTMINSPTGVSAYWTRNGNIYSFQINQYTLDGCKMALKLESANGDVGYVCISINGND